MIGGLGVGELSIILCIVVVLFGAGRLAGIGSGLGKGIRNFKKEIDPAEKKKLEESLKEKTEEKPEEQDSAI
ncbi:MAG: twin-arginine translocase TatA/TatE family subunit [Deltaproteobacteria bacterium]|jgi:sec-independent protein translocase protein TatA|nr:twin-arginine translocase TatA/TatE family subunit [Deltaproteobacteria bacterium]MBT4263338.1 twin-arginine translocase TatA/TatE family subunit [Deltaproteobacteria bacterium]MBT4639792.1 twin-arginine translocase TatA/TatE family subunit [Deltaproteobacteria bacterium]MBT6499573.1 twin-arginine translocase TatA/TatE family subunit [Deltaproteobacteria bacterium]MBT6614956.1 twin-arginine translocase TatA/TatE family subunit [Deltaproteobacteria bacterium]